MDEGDVMVNSDDRDATLQDRTEVAPVHLETSSRRNDAASVNSELSDTPEYATITSRLRQHDPPSYHSYTVGPLSVSRTSLVCLSHMDYGPNASSRILLTKASPVEVTSTDIGFYLL